MTCEIDIARYLLPGVSVVRVREALERAGGDELGSGKFASDESSAALAVNTFGWFLERPEMLPLLPGLEGQDWPARRVDIERCLRFPWSGGRHPWLDAVTETEDVLIGVESKRFEPFRDAKNGALSNAYDRPVWGERMRPLERIRDDLRAGVIRYRHLDAVQLVKHAFGIRTQADRIGKRPVLYYLFAEPAARSGRAIAEDDRARHRSEIADFAARVAGAEVEFAAASYREWFATWRGAPRAHADAVLQRFNP